MESKSSEKLGRIGRQSRFYLSHVFFTQQSISDKKQNVQNILIGDNSNDFCEIIEETRSKHKTNARSRSRNDTNPFTLKLFGDDYHKKRAKLRHITYKNSKNMHSFLIKHNTIIMILRSKKIYFYDIKNDKWHNTHLEIKKKYARDRRCVLIDDKILIISHADNLFFYHLDKNNDVQLIESFKLHHINKDMIDYGMSIVKYQKIQKNNDNMKIHEYRIAVVIFGGNHTSILESFVIFDILISYDENHNNNNNNDNNNNSNINVDEKNKKIVKKGENACASKIDKNSTENKKCWKVKILNTKKIHSNSIKCINVKKNKLQEFTLFDFGFSSQCIFNLKYEPIIIMVGSNYGEYSSSIFLFNTMTNTLTLKKDVKRLMFTKCIFGDLSMFNCFMFYTYIQI